MTESFYKYLREEQYRDPSNLDARANLHRRFSRNRQGLHRWIFDFLLERIDGKVLELGAGPGYLLRRNLDRIPSEVSFFLSDVSHGMMSAARSELGVLPFNSNYAVIDAQSLPFPSSSFQNVIANHMIYHIPDIPKAIAEMQRVLTDGGCLLAATNGDDHLYEIDELVHSIEPSITFGSRDLKESRHLPFSMSNGERLLSASFERVISYEFDDELIITKIDPLVQYILSFPGNAWEVFSVDGKLAELKATIEKKIRREGAFCVTKSAGLFIAMKG